MGSTAPADAPRDSRLDAYRDRVGVTQDDSGQDGTVLVRTQTWWDKRGHLWWRRYSRPTELPVLWMIRPDGAFQDFLIPRDDVESLTREWRDGRLGRFNEKALTVRWLDMDESRRLADQLFGV